MCTGTTEFIAQIYSGPQMCRGNTELIAHISSSL